MATEILLYSPIYSFTAEDYIKKLEDNKGNDISVRMNCPGGDVYSAYGMIAKFNEHEKGKKMKVDGQAKSGGFYLCCAADEAECLTVSDFMAHRAAAPYWVEMDPDLFNAETKAQLTKVNKDLREIVESKVSAETFKKVTGVSLDDMFSLDTRIDVRFNADQAKEMGLVQKIIPITKEAKEKIEAMSATYGVAAFSIEPKIESSTPTPTTINTNTNKNKAMTAAEFQAAHPAEYAKIKAEGREEGITAEHERVLSWQTYKAIDPEAVEKGIAGKEAVSAVVQNAMIVKAMAGGMLKDAKDGNPEKVKTAATAAQPTAEEANTNEFLANCMKDLNLEVSAK